MTIFLITFTIAWSVGLLIGLAAGFNYAVKRMPTILARMTPEQLRILAVAVDERRPKTPT